MTNCSQKRVYHEAKANDKCPKRTNQRNLDGELIFVCSGYPNSQKIFARGCCQLVDYARLQQEAGEKI